MKRNRVDLICEQCGQPFWVHNFRRDKARFCSRTCHYKWRKGRTINNFIVLPINDIVAAYRQGESAASLAQEYGVSIWTIYNRLRKSDVELRGPTGENLNDPKTRQALIEWLQQRTGSDHPNYKDLPIEEIGKRYAAGESSEHIAKDYGVDLATILHRVREAGIPVRPAGYVERRECPDGHIADSGYEYEVDKWLSEHSIEHQVHPRVPWWNGGKSPQRADFRVGDIFIEVWGIRNSKRYNRCRREKIAHYKECGTKLIEIFPHHIIDGDMSPLQVLFAP